MWSDERLLDVKQEEDPETEWQDFNTTEMLSIIASRLTKICGVNVFPWHKVYLDVGRVRSCNAMFFFHLSLFIKDFN